MQPLAGVTDVDTHTEAWRDFAHSFTSLLEGVHKPLDANGEAWPEGSGAAKYAGKPACDGHIGACVFVLAHDREHAANELGCPN